VKHDSLYVARPAARCRARPAHCRWTDAILEAIEDATFTLTCTYANLNDGAEVRADLDANYETNGLSRAISGSPASIIVNGPTRLIPPAELWRGGAAFQGPAARHGSATTKGATT
jgi:hypothetical protein